MLSSVVNSGRAVQVNIAIMRAFVKLREIMATNRELARKFAEWRSGWRPRRANPGHPGGHPATAGPTGAEARARDRLPCARRRRQGRSTSRREEPTPENLTCHSTADRSGITHLIINSPFEEPTQHWHYRRETRSFSLEPGRRPAGCVIASETSILSVPRPRLRVGLRLHRYPAPEALAVARPGRHLARDRGARRLLLAEIARPVLDRRGPRLVPGRVPRGRAGSRRRPRGLPGWPLWRRRPGCGRCGARPRRVSPATRLSDRGSARARFVAAAERVTRARVPVAGRRRRAERRRPVRRRAAVSGRA